MLGARKVPKRSRSVPRQLRSWLCLGRRDLGQRLQQRLELVARRHAPEAEADRTGADLAGHAHRGQDGRRLTGRRVAGGAGGWPRPRAARPGSRAPSGRRSSRSACSAGAPSGCPFMTTRSPHPRLQLEPQPVAQARARRPSRPDRRRAPRPRREPTSSSTFSVPARRPHSWPAPCSNGSSLVALADVERARRPSARRTCAPATREQVDAELVDPGRDLADRLRGVAVQEDAGFARDAGDLGDRLDRADLVVGVHHRDEDGVRPDGARRRRRDRPGRARRRRRRSPRRRAARGSGTAR